MKLKFPSNAELDLSITKVMGSVVISNNDEKSIEDYALEARSFVRLGAELLEVGAVCGVNGIDETKVASAVGAVLDAVDVPVAIHSDDPDILCQAINAGVSMVITSRGLNTPELLSLAREKQVYICIHFGQSESITSAEDAVEQVSEFFFERIDSFLDAKIPRSRILLDPSVMTSSLSTRLKILGRLDEFNNFALPICVAMPGNIPTPDELLSENKLLTLTTSLFCSSTKSVQIIRTTNVADIAIAVGFWQLMGSKNKPYGISKAIIRRFREVRDSIIGHKNKE